MTVLSSDAAVLSADNTGFHWGPVIAGAVVAVAVAFFLVTLGAGVGLALASPNMSHAGTVTFLTLGAIYFFAAEAFSFAVGGHVVGRLIGPAIETTRHEEFRAGLHGLVMWGIAVVVGLMILGLSSVAGGAAMTVSNGSTSNAANSDYWTDMLFRPMATRTDVDAGDLAADKAEASRLLAGDLAQPSSASAQELARLIVLDTDISRSHADQRVAFVEAQMQQQAKEARHAASIASLWTAFALLFGAVVSVAAAISARWEDDRITFSMARRF